MYLEYAKALDASEEVVDWIQSTLRAYLSKHAPSQGDIEHVLDYLCSKDGPQKLKRMSFVQAKEKSDAWLKTQMKKGQHIKESPRDTETIYKFDDGSAIVKLVGKAAFQREGFLMSHCVAEWFNKKDQWVYSYRDKDNNPHATFEVINSGKEIQQIKGKGNGSIHPRYIEPILQFLKSIGFEVRDQEMKNLGYFYLKPKMKALVSEFYAKPLFTLNLGTKEYIFGG